MFLFSVTNPPNVAQANFILASQYVANRMIAYEVGLIEIGTKLLTREDDLEKLTVIYKRPDRLESKFEEVLGLWARNTSGAKWEDLIGKVGQDQLAEELRKKLSVPVRLQTGQDSSSQGDLSV